MACNWGTDSTCVDFTFTPFPCSNDDEYSIVNIYKNGLISENEENVLGLIEYYPGQFNIILPIFKKHYDSLLVIKFKNNFKPIIGIITGNHYIHRYDELTNFMNVGNKNEFCGLVDLKESGNIIQEESLCQLIAIMTDFIIKEIDESELSFHNKHNHPIFEGINYINGLDEMTLTLKIIEKCRNRFIFVYGVSSTFRPSLGFSLEDLCNIRDMLTNRQHDNIILNPVLILAQKLQYDAQKHSKTYVEYLREYVSNHMTKDFVNLSVSDQNILNGLL